MSNTAHRINRLRKDSQSKELHMSEVFVPEGGTPLSLDEALRRISALQKETKATKAKMDNLKQVAKTHMKAQGLKKYESPEVRSCLLTLPLN